jgi:hypothetical protein
MRSHFTPTRERYQALNPTFTFCTCTQPLREGPSPFKTVTFGNHHSSRLGEFRNLFYSSPNHDSPRMRCPKPLNVLALEHVGTFLMLLYDPSFSPRFCSFLLPSSLLAPSVYNTSISYNQTYLLARTNQSAFKEQELPAGPATKTTRKDMSLFAYPSEFWICCCRTPKENVLSVSLARLVL